MDVQTIASNTTAAPAAATPVQSAPRAKDAEPAEANVQPSLTQVREAVKSINRSMGALARGLEFSVDTDSHRTVVKVVDQQTKELIRQIPSVETLEIAQALDKAQGLLIKQQA